MEYFYDMQVGSDILILFSLKKFKNFNFIYYVKYIYIYMFNNNVLCVMLILSIKHKSEN